MGTTSAQRICESMASSRFTKQIKDVLFFHAEKESFPSSDEISLLLPNNSLFQIFTEEVEIPVADKEKSVEKIQAMGFAEEENRKHVLTWNILSCAIKGKTYNDILRRVTSPTAAWRLLIGLYGANTPGATLQCMKSYTNRRRVKPGSDPVHTLSEMADDDRDFEISEKIAVFCSSSLAGRVRCISTDD